MNLEAMLKRKEELTPKQGYNLVGVDAMEVGEDALYLIDHFATEDEAKKALQKKSATTRDKLYIYGPSM